MAPSGTVSVHVSETKASWNLSREEVDGMKKGTKLVSELFRLPSMETDLVLNFYPRGLTNSESSNCGVFLEPKSVPLTLSYELQVGGVSQTCTRCFKKGEGDWGFGDMGSAVDGTAVEITLVVHWFCAMEDADAVSKAVKDLQQVKKTLQDTESQLALRTRQLKAAQAEVTQEKSLAAQAALRRRVAAVAVQRAWRRACKRAQEARTLAERVRKLRRRHLECRLALLQRRWRERQLELQRRRTELHERRTPKPRPTSAYDVVVKFQSLSEFTSTGAIDVLRAVESRLDLALEANYRIVAVVGLFDKGKTFLINKLFDVNLPSGKLHTTMGFSFYLVEERRMLILDSAGVQGTVSYRTQVVQPILDAQSTESFMFEMISRIAHHMIFVVNDFTWFEQKYIAMLHQKYVQKNQTKELIVVHNLRSTSSVKEAQKLFQQQIVQCYEGQTSHLTQLSFTASRGVDVPHVHHIGICEDASEAGEKFNDPNCKLIMQMLELRDMLGSPVLLSKLLKEEMDQLLPIFLNVEVGDTPASQQQASLIVEFAPVKDAEEVSGGYARAGRFELRSSPAEARVVMKTRGVISDLGEIIAHDVTFKPIVNIYDKGRDQDVRRIVEVECPGVREEDVEWEERPNGVRLTIEKSKGIDEVSVQPVAPIRQCHGRWVHDFDFETSEGKFQLCAEEISMDRGLLMVPLRRWAQARRGRLGSRRTTGAADSVLGPPGPGSTSSTIITSGFTDLGAESSAE